MQKPQKPTMISLFAGAGGLDIGLEQAGFVSLAVNEYGPHACESLRQNKILNTTDVRNFDDWFSENVSTQRCYTTSAPSDFIDRTKSRLRKSVGSHSYLDQAAIVEGDIRNISSEHMLQAAGAKKNEITLIAGGPPCQPFSRAGKRETVETGDGKLFLEFVRMVDEVRPRWFLFENVKGLAQSKTLVPFAKCNSCKHESVIPFDFRDEVLTQGNYDKTCQKCGSPATEIKVKEQKGGSLTIILEEFQRLGYKCYHAILNSANYGVPQSRERLFIVGSRDGEDFSWPEVTHQEKTSLDGSEQLDLLTPSTRKKPWVTVKDVLWENGHPNFGMLDYEKAVLWVKNVVRPHAEAVTWHLDRPSPTIGAHQGAKLAIAPFGVPEAQLARQQWHTLGRRQSDLPPVFVVHEMLSDEELLQLQTFPAGWYLHGTRMERAFQIGNAVPPAFAKAVGEAILTASGIPLN